MPLHFDDFTFVEVLDLIGTLISRLNETDQIVLLGLFLKNLSFASPTANVGFTLEDFFDILFFFSCSDAELLLQSVDILVLSNTQAREQNGLVTSLDASLLPPRQLTDAFLDLVRVVTLLKLSQHFLLVLPSLQRLHNHIGLFCSVNAVEWLAYFWEMSEAAELHSLARIRNLDHSLTVVTHELDFALVQAAHERIVQG